MATENKMHNIEILDAIKPDDIHKAYRDIDVIVNPRVKSKLTATVTPLKPLEAMAYRKVVIASDVGGMKELIIDGKTGFLFNAGDKEDLKRKIVDILNASKKDLNEIILKAHGHIIKERNWLENAKKYATLYHELTQH